MNKNQNKDINSEIEAFNSLNSQPQSTIIVSKKISNLNSINNKKLNITNNKNKENNKQQKNLNIKKGINKPKLIKKTIKIRQINKAHVKLEKDNDKLDNSDKDSNSNLDLDNVSNSYQSDLDKSKKNLRGYNDITNNKDSYVYKYHNDNDEITKTSKNTDNINNIENTNNIEEKNENVFKKWTLITENSNYTSYLNIDKYKFQLNNKPQDKLGTLQPHGLFKLFFTEELYESMLESTNTYIKKFKKKHENAVSCRVGKVDIITANELKLFIGVYLYLCFNYKSAYIGICILIKFSL